MISCEALREIVESTVLLNSMVTESLDLCFPINFGNFPTITLVGPEMPHDLPGQLPANQHRTSICHDWPSTPCFVEERRTYFALHYTDISKSKALKNTGVPILPFQNNFVSLQIAFMPLECNFCFVKIL